jgi:hypothetical protein
VGEDYEILLEVIPLFGWGIDSRGIQVMMLLRGRRKRRFCVMRMKRRETSMRRQQMGMENAVDHARNQDQVQLPKKTIH